MKNKIKKFTMPETGKPRIWKNATHRVSKGFTLIELMIATVLMGIITIASFSTVSQIYGFQKRSNITQHFYTETRFVMEKIEELIRQNIIDYDRYFLEVGPKLDDYSGTYCSTFNTKQLHTDFHSQNTNEKITREKISYESVFMWDTNNDDVQDRQLGGVTLEIDDLTNEPKTDPCTQAFYTTTVNYGTDQDYPTLFLVNSAHTLRHAIRSKDNRIQLQKLLGADTDNDGNADKWGVSIWDQENSKCEIEIENEKKPTLIVDAQICASSHDWTNISPRAVKIEKFSLNVSPDRDPYLAFKNNEVQMHPIVSFALEVSLNNPAEWGFSAEQIPKALLQSAAGSRVYGNTRK